MTESVWSRRAPGLVLLAAFAAWLTLFAVLWAPYYLFGDEGRHYLFPIVFLAEGLVLAGAVVTIALTARLWIRGALSGWKPVALLIASGMLIFVGPMLLWFGNAFDPRLSS